LILFSSPIEYSSPLPSPHTTPHLAIQPHHHLHWASPYPDADFHLPYTSFAQNRHRTLPIPTSFPPYTSFLPPACLSLAHLSCPPLDQSPPSLHAISFS
uniref:Uncharacterized protein n=1 Tax=Oryza brachyantha TaxID=4533 RepID=J3N273_ORYBR